MPRVVRWVCGHPLATGLGVVAILALSAVGVARIRVETDLIRSLRHASPLAAAARFVDENLAGVNSVEIIIDGVSIKDPAALDKVARFEDAVRGLPYVRKVTGLPDVLRGSTAPCTEATTRMRISRTGRTRRPTSRTFSPA